MNLETNLARLGTATQSGTFGVATAARAIDGNTNGDFGGGSVSHTQSQLGSQVGDWWLLDLGAVRRVSRIVLWNRTDCCSFRLSNFVVSAAAVEATPEESTLGWTFQQNDPVGSSTHISVNGLVRYVKIQLRDVGVPLALAEVEVWGSRIPLRNLAPEGVATQSSTVHGGLASLAVDNNASGDFFARSVTHTHPFDGNQQGAWWQLDLGAIRYVNRIKIWNRTDCCSDRLSRFYVSASLLEEAPTYVVSAFAADANFRSWAFAHEGTPTPTTILIDRPVRYVKIQLGEPGVALSLAEVEVWGRETPFRNLAREGMATQSSTVHGGAAGRAIDGNLDGNFFAGSVTHTANGGAGGSWWQVDLGSEQFISRVDLWNRTDCCGDRLADFRIEIGRDPTALVSGFGANHWFVPGVFPILHAPNEPRPGFPAGQSFVGFAGRYVRVTLPPGVALSLAEVQVWGGEDLDVTPLTNFRPAQIDPFSVVIASDPQFWWHVDGQRVSHEESEESNWRHVAAMNLLSLGDRLPPGFTPPLAVVINGDLTAFARWNEWDRYDAIYGELYPPIYPGLGNHDYGGNVVADCAANAEDIASYGAACYAETQHQICLPLRGDCSCVVEAFMVSDGHDWCARDSARRMNWWITQHQDSLQGYDRGSLAYSWDLGNVRFIQLQFYPTYEEPRIYISQSLTWLRDELRKARSDRRWVVLNMHDFGDHLALDDPELLDTLSGYAGNVLGIFSGHIHCQAGFRGEIRVDGQAIPWFRSGAAEYNMFNLVQFDENGMQVTVIDSNHSNPVHYTGAKNLDGGDAAAPFVRDYPSNLCPGALLPRSDGEDCQVFPRDPAWSFPPFVAPPAYLTNACL